MICKGGDGWTSVRFTLERAEKDGCLRTAINLNEMLDRSHWNAFVSLMDLHLEHHIVFSRGREYTMDAVNDKVLEHKERGMEPSSNTLGHLRMLTS
jgi:hypothetical protein